MLRLAPTQIVLTQNEVTALTSTLISRRKGKEQAEQEDCTKQQQTLANPKTNLKSFRSLLSAASTQWQQLTPANRDEDPGHVSGLATELPSSPPSRLSSLPPSPNLRRRSGIDDVRPHPVPTRTASVFAVRSPPGSALTPQIAASPSAVVETDGSSQFPTVAFAVSSGGLQPNVQVPIVRAGTSRLNNETIRVPTRNVIGSMTTEASLATIQASHAGQTSGNASSLATSRMADDGTSEDDSAFYRRRMAAILLGLGAYTGPRTDDLSDDSVSEDPLSPASFGSLAISPGTITSPTFPSHSSLQDTLPAPSGPQNYSPGISGVSNLLGSSSGRPSVSERRLSIGDNTSYPANHPVSPSTTSSPTREPATGAIAPPPSPAPFPRLRHTLSRIPVIHPNLAELAMPISPPRIAYPRPAVLGEHTQPYERGGPVYIWPDTDIASLGPDFAYLLEDTEENTHRSARRTPSNERIPPSPESDHIYGDGYSDEEEELEYEYGDELEDLEGVRTATSSHYMQQQPRQSLDVSGEDVNSSRDESRDVDWFVHSPDLEQENREQGTYEYGGDEDNNSSSSL